MALFWLRHGFVLAEAWLAIAARPQAMAQLGDLIVPESERIASDINDLEATFDPAQELTFDVEYETVPPIKWTRSYKDAEVTIRCAHACACPGALQHRGCQLGRMR
eukprot:202497-Chlamydomonas_euryale.AAC.1